MKISVAKRMWWTQSQWKSLERLAKHCMTHYPKDVALHKLARGAFKSMDECGRKLSKAAKATPKRRTMKRRATSKRRPARRPTAKRRTVRRRRSMARRAMPKRRTARRTVRRRRAA
jgi:hypothetical protein